MDKNITLKYALLVCLIHALLLCAIFFNLEMPKVALDGSNRSGLIQVRWLGNEHPNQVQQKFEAQIQKQQLQDQAMTRKQTKPEVDTKSPAAVKTQPKSAPTQQPALHSASKSDQQRSAGGETVSQDKQQQAKSVNNTAMSSSNNNGRQTEQAQAATTAKPSATANSKYADASGAGATSAAKAQHRFKILNRRVNYPVKAQSMGVEGQVKVAYDISQSGNVVNIRILDESPVGLFSMAVKQDMRRWRYQSNQHISNLVVTIVFKLDGSVQLKD